MDGHESLRRAAWLEEPAPSSAAVEPAAVLRLVVQQSCVLVLMTEDRNWRAAESPDRPHRLEYLAVLDMLSAGGVASVICAVIGR